jgi:hypothetical protein
MFSFENGPNIEAVPNACELFGNTLNILHLKKDGCFSLASL